MRNKVKHLLLLSCLGMSGAAFADTAEELTRIESETAVLKAKAKKIEVQAQIAAKQAEIDKLTMPDTPPTAAGAIGAVLPAGFADPTIHAIESIGKQRYATLSFGGATTIDVKVGDVLPNGARVIAIQPSEVIISGAGKARIRLTFSTHGANVAGYASTLPLPGGGLPMTLGSRGVSAR